MDVPTLLTPCTIAAVEDAVGTRVTHAFSGQRLSTCHTKHEHLREIGRRGFARVSGKTEQVVVRDHVSANPVQSAHSTARQRKGVSDFMRVHHSNNDNHSGDQLITTS